MIIWSCGGGLQSVAIAVLVRRGLLPLPDLSCIADTGREVQTTWDYLAGVLNPYLAPAGVAVEIIPHELSTVDLYGKNGDILIPAYGKEGKLPTFCSNEWKQRVCSRWLRSRGVGRCVVWLGYSLDEYRRRGPSPVQWQERAYPLIERNLTRAACRALIEAEGLPLPKKSRCWCCPHQNEAEWQEVRSRPGEWSKAVALDEALRADDELYLHSSRVPLALADLAKDESLPLFRGCQDSGCFT